jgi:hypothetical protein
MGGITKAIGLGGGTTVVAPPPPAAPPPAPTVTDAQARAQADRRQAEAAQTRKRGRASTVLTGPEGVGNTPVQVKTLVGS